MKCFRSLSRLFSTALTISVCALPIWIGAQSPTAAPDLTPPNDSAVAQRANRLLSQMTADEKIGQIESRFRDLDRRC